MRFRYETHIVYPNPSLSVNVCKIFTLNTETILFLLFFFSLQRKTSTCTHAIRTPVDSQLTEEQRNGKAKMADRYEMCVSMYM